MASSGALFRQYANCCGSSESGGEEVMKVLTKHSEHFMMVEVSATGQQLFRQKALVFLRTRAKVFFFLNVGTTDWNSEGLKILSRYPVADLHTP